MYIVMYISASRWLGSRNVEARQIGFCRPNSLISLWPGPSSSPPGTSSFSQIRLSLLRPTASEFVSALARRPGELAVAAAATRARETCVQPRRSPCAVVGEASPLPLLRVPELAPHLILVVPWPKILHRRKETASNSISPREATWRQTDEVPRSACRDRGPWRSYSLRRFIGTQRLVYSRNRTIIVPAAADTPAASHSGCPERAGAPESG